MRVLARSRRPFSDRLRRRLRRDFLRPFVRGVVAPTRRLWNSHRTYRPIFVTGSMGSGTTLLAFSLGSRYECAALIRESGLEIRTDSFLHMCPPREFESVRSYKESLFPDPSWSVDEGRQALLELYQSQASGPSKVVIDKGPNANLVRVPFLLECFPDARVVLVFRDPVATIEGFRRKWPLFGHDSLDESIRFQAALNQRFLEDTIGLEGVVTTVAYEMLTKRYDDILDALGDRLGLEPARRARRLETRVNVEGQGIRNVRRSQIHLDTKANQKSYQRLSREEIEYIWEALGGLHRELEARSFFQDSSAAIRDDPATAAR